MRRRLLRLPPRTAERLAAELDEEIRLHLEIRAERLVRGGMTPEAARAEAERRFGAVASVRGRLYREARRRERRRRLSEGLRAAGHDLRTALRLFAREPAFAAMVVLTMALGIGASAAMFGVIDHLLLRGPEHVRDPGRLVQLFRTRTLPGGEEQSRRSVPYALYATLRDRPVGLDGVAGVSIWEVVMGRGDDAELVSRAAATWDLFPLLGVRPHAGRFFLEHEDRPPRGEPVAVLGHALWQRRFGGDPAAVGRTIEVGGAPYTVIGVAPRGFTAPDRTGVDVWTPISAPSTSRQSDWATQWNLPQLWIVARLAAGVSPERAALDATAAYQAAFAGINPAYADARLRAAPLHFGFDGREPHETVVARWLAGVGLILLLITCANVANLHLARWTRREREVAVRLALGIGRGRLARLLVAESVLLAAAGGAAAVLLAQWGGTLVRASLAPDARWTMPLVDGRVLVFTAALSLVVGVLVGAAPATTLRRRAAAGALRAGVREGGGGGGGGGGGHRSPARAALTVVQTACAVALLAGTGLFVRSFSNLTGLPLGIEPESVLAASVTWPALPASEAAGGPLDAATRAALQAERETLHERALQRLLGAPGVEHAAVSAGTPFHAVQSVNMGVAGWDSVPADPGAARYPYVSAVTRDYFATVGTRLVRGRLFPAMDGTEGAVRERVAVVSETMARTFWPGGTALGECLHIGPASSPCTRVVGVVEDVRQSLLQDRPPPHYYVLLAEQPLVGVGPMLLVRPRGDPHEYAGELRAILQELAGPDGFVRISTLQERVDPQARPWKTAATLFGLFSVLALGVAALGLFGVVSYLVAQRTHEVGVRMALGARAAQVGWMVLGQGATLLLVGLGIGALVTLAAGRYLDPLLFEVTSSDPIVLGAVAAVVLTVGAAALVAPALRAARVDPLAALRAE